MRDFISGSGAAEGEGPRIYRIDQRTRHAVNFCLIAMGGLFLTLSSLYLIGVLPYRGTIGGLLMDDLAIAGIGLFLGSGYNKRVILHRDSVEVVGWFRRRTMRFTEIRGRLIPAQWRLPYGYPYLLMGVGPESRKLALPRLLHTDEFFRAWLRSIPEIRG